MFLLLSNVPASVSASIAQSLVEEKYAACVTETPVKSTYEWEGKILRDEEVTLTIKVASEAIEDTKRRLVELHPYEVPEVLAIPVDVQHSHDPYVDWVNEQCRRETD